MIDIVIRDYKPGDKSQVMNIVFELEKYYPNIREWFPKQIEKIDKGELICKVAELKGKIGGVAFSGRKNEHCVKLKTFYITKDFRGSAIGPRLLETIVDYWVKERIRKIYVTFAEEEVDELLPFFQEYGFLFDGIAPFAYRPNVSEYIMSKMQVYGEITEKEFFDFVWHYLFRLRGYRKIDGEKDFLILQKIISIKEAYKIYVKIITDISPAKKLFDEISKEAGDIGCTSKILVTYYPLPFSHKNEDIKVIDGYDIETLFYPLVLRRSRYTGVISSIEKRYADRILYDPSQMLLDADRRSLRIDKVFYKYPQAFKEMRRGSTFVFYQSGPTKAIVGEGKIKEVDIDTPERLYQKYSEKGVLKLSDIEKFADQKNKAMAILFGKTTRYENEIPLRKIRNIKPAFNPQGATFISQEELDIVREQGGVRTNERLDGFNSTRAWK